MENKFYNYVLLDPRKPGDYNYGDLHFDFEPFYVGKGIGNRYKEHLVRVNKDVNKLKKNKIKKILLLGLDIIIKKVYINISEQESFDNELNLIKLIGRFNLKKGPLTNLTNGGEGVSGVIFSNKRKKQISIKSKGRRWRDESKLKLSVANKGKKHTDEVKLKISTSNKGRKFSDEHKLNLSLAKIGKKNNISDEGRKKISETHKGKQYALGIKRSDECKQKMSESRCGRKCSDETKLKISIANKGRKPTDEVRIGYNKYLARIKEEKLNQQNNIILGSL